MTPTPNAPNKGGGPTLLDALTAICGCGCLAERHDGGGCTDCECPVMRAVVRIERRLW